MTLADLLVVMNAGQVEQIGAPLDVYEKPASTFVAAFIGAPAMNLLAVSASEAASLAPGRAVPPDGAVIGVRPDDLKLDGTHPGPPAGLALDLAVTAVERVGPESFVYGSPAVGRGEVIVRVPGTHAPAPGERIRALAAPDRLHLFSTAGRRLPA
jgi:sn-glycerol 3-phosphate transport system ATP-binding protein